MKIFLYPLISRAGADGLMDTKGHPPPYTQSYQVYLRKTQIMKESSLKQLNVNKLRILHEYSCLIKFIK